MTRRGFVWSVIQHSRFPERHDVFVHVSESKIALPLYTEEPLGKEYLSSLCKRSKVLHSAVSLDTSQTQFGERINAVTFLSQEEEEVA